MKKETLQIIKDIILKEIKEISVSCVSGKSLSEVDLDGDPVDMIQGTMLSSLQSQINSRNTYRILMLEKALQRMDNGTYGLCEDCEEEIPDKRLMAKPCVVTCVCCAEDRETTK